MTYDDKQKETHPSYGTVTISRVSSSHNRGIFQSAFKHGNWISLRIYEADLYRSLSNDRVHAGKEIIDIALSESQFARLLSSAGIGEGVPCTIMRRDSKQIEECPVEERRAKFDSDVDQALTDMNKDIGELQAKIRILTEKKGVLNKEEKRSLIDVGERIERVTKDTLPFIRNQFIENMDMVTDEARTEIAQHIQNVMQRTGLEHLQEDTLKLSEGYDTKALPEGDSTIDIEIGDKGEAS